MLDEELGQAVGISQTFLQLSKEVTMTKEKHRTTMVAMADVRHHEKYRKDCGTDGTALTHSLCQS